MGSNLQNPRTGVLYALLNPYIAKFEMKETLMKKTNNCNTDLISNHRLVCFFVKKNVYNSKPIEIDLGKEKKKKTQLIAKVL